MRTRVLLGGLLVLGSTVMAAEAAVAGGGCHHPVTGQAEATTTIAMRNMCITPGVVRVDLGDTVEVINEDSVLHNLYGLDWFHGDLAPGERTKRTFDEAGTFTFACTLHPGMTGAVTVGDTELISTSAPAKEGDGLSTAATLAFAFMLLVCVGSGWSVGRFTRPSRATSAP